MQATPHGFNNVVVRELAQALELELEQIPYLISNVKNEELSLTDRVKNTGKRALFISIHHDSVQPQYCNLNTSPCRTDYASGYSLFVSKVNRNFRISKEIASKIARHCASQDCHRVCITVKKFRMKAKLC